MPNFSENLEVNHTAGINFDFSEQSAQFKIASMVAATFRTPLEILTKYLTNSFKINRVNIICMTSDLHNMF